MRRTYDVCVYCPSCLAEYRAGFTHCPDCDVDLVAELPSGDEPFEVDDGTTTEGTRVGPDAVEVYRAFRDIEAELLRSLLEDAGITVALFRGGLTAYGVGIPPEIKVMVARDQAEAAVAVIRAAEQGENALTELDEIAPNEEL